MPAEINLRCKVSCLAAKALGNNFDHPQTSISPRLSNTWD